VSAADAGSETLGPYEGGHPIKDLDDVVHQRVRLGILAVLREAHSADFAYLRDTLDLTDGNLARHLKVLTEAGYVTSTKTFERGRSRTWLAATRSGRAAFDSELAALQALFERVGTGRAPTAVTEEAHG
jgi:DNA-binding MarR family transcriptional regulator